MPGKAKSNPIVSQAYREKKLRKVKGDKMMERTTMKNKLVAIEEEANNYFLSGDELRADKDLSRVFDEEKVDPEDLRAHTLSASPGYRAELPSLPKKPHSSLGFHEDSPSSGLPAINARTRNHTSTELRSNATRDLDSVSMFSTTSSKALERRKHATQASTMGLQYDTVPPLAQSISEVPVTSVSVSHLVTASAMFPLDQAMKAWMNRTIQRAGDHHKELFHDLFKRCTRVFTRTFRNMKEVASPKTIEQGGIFLQLWKCYSEVFEICQSKIIELSERETHIEGVSLEKGKLEQRLVETEQALEDTQVDLFQTNTRRLELEDEVRELRRLIDPEWDEDKEMSLKKAQKGPIASQFGRGERAEFEARIEEMRKEISFLLGESSKNAQRVREELEREKRKMHEENHRRNQKAEELEMRYNEVTKENERLKEELKEKNEMLEVRTPRPAWSEMNMGSIFNKVPEEFVTKDIVSKLMDEVKRLREQLGKYQRILVEPIGGKDSGTSLAQKLLLKYDATRKSGEGQSKGGSGVQISVSGDGGQAGGGKPGSGGSGLKVPSSPGGQNRSRRPSMNRSPNAGARNSNVGPVKEAASAAAAAGGGGAEVHGLGAFSLDDIVEGALNDGYFTAEEIVAKIKEKMSGQDEGSAFLGLGISTKLPKFLRYRGKIRMHAMSKRETEMMARDVWEKKQQFDASRGIGPNGEVIAKSGQAPTTPQVQAAIQQQGQLRMSEYFMLYLQNRFGNFPSVVAEWAYSLIFSLNKFNYDADCRILLKVLLDEVDDVVVHDQKSVVEKLEKALLKADMQENGQKLSEKLSKKICDGCGGEAVHAQK